MEFRAHHKLRDSIKQDTRDIALITAPGMGLSTLLEGLVEKNKITVVFIKPDVLQKFWDDDFKKRSHGNKFVIHAATIDALLRDNIINTSVDIYRTNLKKFLTEFGKFDDLTENIYIILDDFDELSDDLEKVILNELKAISDQKQNELGYEVFNSLRFIVGGCIDFQNLYPENISGVSPATQFCKHYPEDFLLSFDEIDRFLKSQHPDVIKIPYATGLILEWSGGYLYYVEHLARWISNEMKENPSPSFEFLATRLRDTIEENKSVPLLKYCRKAWGEVKTRDELKQILYQAVKTPYIKDATPQAKNLMKIGLLLEMHLLANKNMYQIANRIVEMFIRQRLAELNLVLPISESLIWGIKDQSVRAYSLLLEIENRLRNFIGDILFKKNAMKWTECLNIDSKDGYNIFEKVAARRNDDSNSIYTTGDRLDSTLSYLDFGDLAVLIQKYSQDFPKEFAEKAPGFLTELNYHRRRIAHNRTMTIEQISSIETRWQQMIRMMMKSV